MAPEQLPGKCPIKQAKQEDLQKVDIWQLGITLFCFVNPGLNVPFDIEFDRMTDIPEFTENFIANYLDAGNLLAKCRIDTIFSDRYVGTKYTRHTVCARR